MKGKRRNNTFISLKSPLKIQRAFLFTIIIQNLPIIQQIPAFTGMTG
jgi:hypothetical protein